MKEFFQFALAAIKMPLKVGTVFPATRFLAEEMVSGLQLSQDALVIELGPGTGSITDAIVRILPHQESYIGIELNDQMISVLNTRFPNLKMIKGSAEDLLSFLPAGKKANVILSSLPWALFPTDLQDRIFTAVRASLAPDGQLVAYGCTSGLRSPTSQYFQRLLEKNFRVVKRSPIVWRNIPPATVFYCHDPK